MNSISFPGLGIGPFGIDRVAFHIGSLPIYWYGILIAAGMLLAFLYAVRRLKDFDLTFDDLSDITLWGIVFGIIGARLYYVLFFVDPTTQTNPYFSDPLSMLRIWEGGLGIYGGIIGAFATVFVFCKIKKQNPFNYLDIASLGFLIGQCLGRWGNFFNAEAYGSTTSLPWGMSIGGAQPVHPCFLYESLWCLIGFVLLHFFSKKHKKYPGQIFLLYAAWYSFERFFVEMLRSDSLLIGGLKISVLLSGIVFVAAVTMLVFMHIKSAEKENEELAYNPVYSDIEKELSGEAEPSSETPAEAKDDTAEATADTEDSEKTAQEDENAGDTH